MSGRQSRGGGNNPRQNEYFVPRDGIDREVITADICRYLGNDALVRPGTYQDDNSGRTIQGYYITAYRNLTTAMIDDLKNDSARWDQERRKHQSGAVRYQDSAIHRNQSGYTASSGGFAGSSTRETYTSEAPTMSYPGSDAPGYSASRQQAATAAGYNQSGYGTTGYATGPGFPPTGVTYSTTPYATGTGTAGLGAGGMGSYAPGVPAVPYTDPVPLNVRHPESSYRDYQMEDAPPAMGGPRTSAGYSTTGPRPGYVATTQAPTAATYGGYTASPVATAGYATQPVDNFYGRANPAAGVGYGQVPEQPPYEDQMPAPRGAATAPGAQGQGGSSGRHERDRGERGDRDRGDRDRERERDRDRDRRERDRKPHHYGR